VRLINLCRHIQQDRSIYKGGTISIPEVMPMGRGRPMKCPECGDSKAGSRSRGFKYYADGKKSRDRQCKACGKRYLVRIK
jgi:hypothetical protein